MQKFHSVFLFNRVYFVSRLTGPAYIPAIGWKMTSLIDMQALVEIYRSKIYILSGSSYRSKVWETSKKKEVWNNVKTCLFQELKLFLFVVESN